MKNSRLLWMFRHKSLLSAKAHKKQLEASSDASVVSELLQSAYKIHSQPYSQASALLGQTFSAAVLQDMQALTPNLLAQTIETVAAGGVVILLGPPNCTTLSEISHLTMDAHRHFKTPGYPKVSERKTLNLFSRNGKERKAVINLEYRYFLRQSLINIIENGSMWNGSVSFWL